MKHTTILLSLGLLSCIGGQAPVAPQTDTQSTLAPDSEKMYDASEWYTFEAGPYVLPPGSERYFCYSHVLEEDLYVDEIVLNSNPSVHHVVYAKTSSPDPDGFFECDILFQNNWIPIFVAGTGDASIQMPAGAGHVLKKGTQLTVQLHLLNATIDEVTETVPLRFHRMKEAPQQEVQVVVFGSMNINLPPNQASEVVGDCQSDSDMQIFSVFPHMHLMGRSLSMKTGSDSDNMVEVFRRDPYIFDDQSLATIDLEIKTGDPVTITCGYENTLDETVGFGESTTSEMCFLIGFATGANNDLAGCIDTSSSSLLPEGCGDDPPNELGLGAPCTKGGGECENGFLCTEDIEQTEGLNVCIGLGCESSADCGTGGVCCNIEQAGGVALCLPPACVFSICQELP